jgi:hypothetical protein
MSKTNMPPLPDAHMPPFPKEEKSDKTLKELYLEEIDEAMKKKWHPTTSLGKRLFLTFALQRAEKRFHAENADD